ncbi:SubName: Full=Uncharacterized protein {ECO:0000313/EMBL:CCA73534.1} [Serendipita indica DSM 11827]|uniref:ditrans,polycis-polyprenyl diphosphate synthase [(2E,6E)-farnesyldiphosphate specific] n=1 Tax=Serendipita indica (strain DSM 11827) TaxID=1109443 RepID=G4TQE7_SERID|nr:SubName: Full=Uncharacterized protein {ECO:0000313/EMBL:CCA73534.1} [Serendipita indica DSM 11827]CCA73534.1 hypothetical protein PIIN_07487 [Serendipita indica DSM 11827]
MLRYALLWLFHLFLALKRFFASLLPRKQPRPLRAHRRKLPNHLAVLLSTKESVGNGEYNLGEAIESVCRLVEWCRASGIEILSVFDSANLLPGAWEEVKDALQTVAVIESVQASSNSDAFEPSRKGWSQLSSALRLPPTPPLSKTASWASIRSMSPDSRDSTRAHSSENTTPTLVSFKLQSEEHSRKRQASLISQEPPRRPGPLTLYIISEQLGRPQIARVARELAFSAVSEPVSKQGAWKESTSVSGLSARLEGKKALKSPLEFEGFPPWQIHLSEVTYIPPRRPQSDILRQFWPVPQEFPGAITEAAFRTALDEYDGAEMRFGK